MEALESINCPRCQRPLGSLDAGGIRLHGCKGCGGVFLSRADVDRLLTALPTETLRASEGLAGRALPVDTRAPLSCPVCRQPMERTHAKLAGVDLDRCAAHGTFYDQGELRRLAEALSGSTYRSPTCAGGAAAPSAAAPAAPAAKSSSSSGASSAFDGAAVAVGVLSLLGDLFD